MLSFLCGVETDQSQNKLKQDLATSQKEQKRCQRQIVHPTEYSFSVLTFIKVVQTLHISTNHTSISKEVINFEPSQKSLVNSPDKSPKEKM